MESVTGEREEERGMNSRPREKSIDLIKEKDRGTPVGES